MCFLEILACSVCAVASAQRAEIKRRQIPPDGYPGFRKAMEAARTWGEQTLRIEKGGE